MENQKKTTKAKSKFTIEQHNKFHEDVGDIISKNQNPSDVLEMINTYITNNNIQDTNAIAMFVLSSIIAVNSTLGYVFNYLNQKTDKDPVISDLFVSNIALMLWQHIRRATVFDEHLSNHPDTEFVEYLKNNFDDVRKVLSILLSTFFIIEAADKVGVNDVFEIVKASLKDTKLSLELCVYTYFFMLHQIAQSRLFTEKTYELTSKLTKLQIIKEKPKEEQKGAKIIPFPKQTVH